MSAIKSTTAKNVGKLKFYVKYTPDNNNNNNNNRWSSSRRLELNIDAQKSIADVKRIVYKYFKIDTTNWIASKSEKKIILEYPKCKLNLTMFNWKLIF